MQSEGRRVEEDSCDCYNHFGAKGVCQCEDYGSNNECQCQKTVENKSGENK